MKLKVNLKNKEVNLEANVEKVIEKGLEQKSNRPERKTRYQIKQEEKRKTMEIQHKQRVQYLFILLGFTVVLAIIGIIGSFRGV